jgi:hypothetical protein
MIGAYSNVVNHMYNEAGWSYEPFRKGATAWMQRRLAPLDALLVKNEEHARVQDLAIPGHLTVIE